MADVLGILGALGVAGSAIAQCYTYGCNVRDAPQDAKDLLKGLMDLSATLTALNGMSYNLPNLTSQSAVKSLVSETLEHLQTIEQDLRSNAPPKTSRMSRDRLKRWTWPFSKDKVRDMIGGLERQKGTISLRLTELSIEMSSMEYEMLDEIANTLKQQSAIGEVERRDKDRSRLLSWLSDYGHEAKLHEVLHRKHPNTGQWVFSTPQWQSWTQDARQVLWIHGKSGSGKTVIAADIVRHLTQQTTRSRHNVLYYFCNANDPAKQSIERLLGSLLRQLCESCHDVPQIVEEAFNRCKSAHSRDRDLTRAELETLVQDCLCDPVMGPVVVLVDAVNEAEVPDEVIEYIDRITTPVSATVRAIIASTTPPRNWAHSFQLQSLPILGEQHSSDLQKFLADQINSMPKLKLLDSNQRIMLISALNERSYGSFLWVRCHLDQLSKSRSLSEILEGIKNLPKSLEEMYNRQLQRLESDTDWERARIALNFLLVAPQKMTVVELAESTTFRMPGMDEPRTVPAFDADKRLLDNRDILDITAPFTSLTTRAQLVGLAHHSVRTFLLQGHAIHTILRLTLPDAHHFVARACLAYLAEWLSGSGMNQPDQPNFTWNETLVKYPLLRYAAMFWPLHVQQSGCEEELVSQTQQIFSQDHGWFQTWLSILRATTDQDFYMPGRHSRQDSPLYHAVSHGLLENTRVLLAQSNEPNEIGGSGGGTLLHAACWGRWPLITELLLEAGADVEAKELFAHRCTAFELAIFREDYDTIFASARLGKLPITTTNLATDICITTDTEYLTRSTGFKKGKGSAILFWACCQCKCTNSEEADLCKRCSDPHCNSCTSHAAFDEYWFRAPNDTSEGSNRRPGERILESIKSGLQARIDEPQTYERSIQAPDAGHGDDGLYYGAQRYGRLELKALRDSRYTREEFAFPRSLRRPIDVDWSSHRYDENHSYTMASSDEYHSVRSPRRHNDIPPDRPRSLFYSDDARPKSQLREKRIYNLSGTLQGQEDTVAMPGPPTRSSVEHFNNTFPAVRFGLPGSPTISPRDPRSFVDLLPEHKSEC